MSTPLLSARLGVVVRQLTLAWACVAATGCIKSGGIDLSPRYRTEQWVVPATFRGPDPFVVAKPADEVLRKDWWRAFDDPVLDALQARAMAHNADLAAAAERFVQARDEMMVARSRLIPHLGVEVEATEGQQSAQAPFRSSTSALRDDGLGLGGVASWEPDLWSKLRNETRMHIFRAEAVAAQYHAARLSLQAELAAAYFTLRGLDAQNAIYAQSIRYYQESLEIVLVKFRGSIASELDVARAEYQLSSSQARQFGVQARRQVVEHALAAMVNAAPMHFSVAPVDDSPLVQVEVPMTVPSTLLQRRPDVAAMEREMARANKGIGVARATFFPSLPLGASGGIAGHFASIFRVKNFFWSAGAFLKVPGFTGGAGRARLQQSWSAYREAEDRYRATLLRAFREVEDGLSRTHLLASEVARQGAAVGAATKQQDLSMELYRGGLASTLDLINAQVNALDARVTAAELKAELRRATVGLVRAMGGGWGRGEMPEDDEIQPFGVFAASGLQKPVPAGHVDVVAEHTEVQANLTEQVNF